MPRSNARTMPPAPSASATDRVANVRGIARGIDGEAARGIAGILDAATLPALTGAMERVNKDTLLTLLAAIAVELRERDENGD